MSGSAGGQKFGKTTLKVIASSIRKGNVIEQDGKLYVVLTAENIHPGKGTPVSQIEMRRISDGVKISERYKTTDQVEKATIEDQNFNYLYKDADGFHFMNNDNYDQVQVPEDVIGSAAPYLQENMTVKLSLHGLVPVAIQMPQRATLEVVETEPVTKGQTASSSYKPAVLSNGSSTGIGLRSMPAKIFEVTALSCISAGVERGSEAGTRRWPEKVKAEATDGVALISERSWSSTARHSTCTAETEGVLKSSA